MFPTLIQFGPFRLPTYTTLLSMGLVGSVILGVWQSQRRGLSPTRVFDAALVGASGGLVGARAAYVALNWAYYEDHLSEALRLWAGGLAWQGGLVVGLLLIALYAARLRLSLAALLDALALGLAWFILFLWLGSGSANDVCGRETFPIDRWLWALSADLPDLYGLCAPRVNVSLLGAAWSALVLLGLWLLASRPPGVLREWPSLPGALFLVCLSLTGLGGLFLVPLQANPAPYLFHLRLDWLYNFLMALGGAGGLLLVKRRKQADRIGRKEHTRVNM